MSPHSISPTDVGKRVTLQYFDDAGARHEVVGILERADVQSGEPVLYVRRRDDSLVGIRMGRIRAGRVVASR